jgi:hypothetical protein
LADVISAALDIGGKLIERLWPDPAQKQAAQLELLRLAQTGELAQLTADTELAKGQLAVNQVEAAAPDLFTRGWRPFIGWICGAGLATQFMIGPLATWVGQLFGATIAFPQLDMGTLLTLLLGMLGLGAMRTAEKIKGAA